MVLLLARVPLLVPGFTVTVWRCWSSGLELGAPCAGLRSPPPPQTNKECRSVRLSAVFQPSAALIGQQIHNSKVQWEVKLSSIYLHTPQTSPELLIFILKSVGQSLFTFTCRMFVTHTHTHGLQGAALFEDICWRVSWMEYIISP